MIGIRGWGTGISKTKSCQSLRLGLRGFKLFLKLFYIFHFLFFFLSIGLWPDVEAHQYMEGKEAHNQD